MTHHHQHASVEVHRVVNGNGPTATITTVVTEHPALLIVSTDPTRYPPEVLHRLAQQIAHTLQAITHDYTPVGMEQAGMHAQSGDTGARLSTHTVKQMLRHVHSPDILATICTAGSTKPLDEWGQYLVHLVTTTLAALEYPHAGCEADVRGTILRMRYLERRRTKAMMEVLHLSERHLHRLQASGISWVAARLREVLGS